MKTLATTTTKTKKAGWGWGWGWGVEKSYVSRLTSNVQCPHASSL